MYCELYDLIVIVRSLSSAIDIGLQTVYTTRYRVHRRYQRTPPLARHAATSESCRPTNLAIT